MHLLYLLLLLHRAADVVNQFLYTHPQPKSALRPLLLETRSQQGSMVKSLRVWGREPLRSASRLLGFVIDLCIWDPGYRLVAGPGRGWCCPQDLFCLAAPASFLGLHLMVVDRGPYALRLIPAAFTKGQHWRGCRRCCRSGQDHSSGNLQAPVLMTLVAPLLQVLTW